MKRILTSGLLSFLIGAGFVPTVEAATVAVIDSGVDYKHVDLGPRIWTKQDGSAGASFEVTAGTVRFLSTRGEMGGEGPMIGGMESAEIPAEDDIPF